jgi:hypothetical protein
MSWRKVTESDLVASLAQNEVEAYRTSGDFEHDPVEQQIAAAVAYVRGCIRTGGKARLSKDESLLPESLVIPTMDYLRYNVLTRKGNVVNESRTNAYEKACLLDLTLTAEELASVSACFATCVEAWKSPDDETCKDCTEK